MTRLFLKTSLVGMLALCAAASAKPTRIEAYGDSITEGFLANTSAVNPPSLEQVSTIVSDLIAYLVRQKDRRFLVPHIDGNAAWPNLIGRSAAAMGVPASVFNAAVSGDESIDVYNQVRTVAATPEQTLALVLMGHNDLPNEKTPEKLGAVFKANMNRGIAEWDRRHQNSVMYLLGIGDVAQVFHVMNGFVWRASPHGNYTCQRSWDMFFYPKVYSDRFRKGTLDKFLAPRRAIVNKTLEDLAFEWSKQSANNKFRYIENLFDAKYEPKQFAVDCFHLSAQGERELAEHLFPLIDKRDWD